MYKVSFMLNFFYFFYLFIYLFSSINISFQYCLLRQFIFYSMKKMIRSNDTDVLDPL